MAPSAISPSMDTSHETNGHQTNGASSLGDHMDNTSSFPTRNGSSNVHASSALSTTSSDQLLDLLCVGFGPASLAIAIALRDGAASSSPEPDVLFMERQEQFSWHAGMQLPGAKMQISFLKDLATPRNPQSHFTFINYLFQNGRLNHFINLSTFLPSRTEYEDYLRWCAGHFETEGKVAYGLEVESVRVAEKDSNGKVTSWGVIARDKSGNVIIRKARHVVIATGGQPIIPPTLQGLKHVAHSSQFATTIKQIQRGEQGRPLKFAVLGGGQSAAEIYSDLSRRFPDAQVRLIIKGTSLRPSDDSPFVNEIFDPDHVDSIYEQEPTARAAAIALDKATNYGVVRLELLEHLYEQLYMQRLRNPDPETWRCRIINNRETKMATSGVGNSIVLKLARTDLPDLEVEEELKAYEMYEADYVFTATGYRRNTHEDMLDGVRELLDEGKKGKFSVSRDYRVKFGEGKVDKRAGVWLQGCNEGTHGLSDTLLSILAVRSGELVTSIFGVEGVSKS